MPDGPRWRVPPGAVFHWRHWDNEHILFHEQSGDTHRLNDLSARAIELLQHGAVTLPELTNALAGGLAEPIPAGFSQTIEKLVLDFATVGLVEPAQAVHDA